MSAEELRGKSVPELYSHLKDLLREGFNLRMQKAVGESAKPDQIKRVRRDIARVKTVITEKRD